ncbi:hypothetical protein BGZ61DRAFT_169165 [Ilyonectria robusta]|uniref:uncharacterized protein n=1 Tax=Ilyonectria robusta TaxID=1079257 RepID=UPI001E8DF3DA|nr:uncharacterized protein BGZ61DRAFT_169165 [Ilyonectria robusta]KAH8734008.1 hypothetical protein BGZ61DRAFT_169165 [Ilyonectria robusta]
MEACIALVGAVIFLAFLLFQLRHSTDEARLPGPLARGAVSRHEAGGPLAFLFFFVTKHLRRICSRWGYLINEWLSGRRGYF